MFHELDEVIVCTIASWSITFTEKKIFTFEASAKTHKGHSPENVIFIFQKEKKLLNKMTKFQIFSLLHLHHLINVSINSPCFSGHH